MHLAAKYTHLPLLLYHVAEEVYTLRITTIFFPSNLQLVHAGHLEWIAMQIFCDMICMTVNCITKIDDWILAGHAFDTNVSVSKGKKAEGSCQEHIAWMKWTQQKVTWTYNKVKHLSLTEQREQACKDETRFQWFRQVWKGHGDIVKNLNHPWQRVDCLGLILAQRWPLTWISHDRDKMQ